MKKYITILPIISCLLSSVCLSQTSASVKNNKQKFCSVKLTKMNGTIENFILAGFSGDSMLGYSFYNHGKNLVIQRNQLIVARSAEIRRVNIKVKKDILVAANSIAKDTVDIEKLESTLVTDNAKTAVTNYAVSGVSDRLLTPAIATPGWDAALLAFDLLFPSTQKWYMINGVDRLFNKMVKDLTRKK